MPSYYADLFARSVSAIPSALGSNMLGLIWPVIIVLCGEFLACVVYGWRVIFDKWKKASLIGFAALGVCYTLLFTWCALSINYKDHAEMATKIEMLQKANDAAESHEQYAVLEARSKCAEISGQNTVLGQQNRDQQNTINKCQTQALALIGQSQMAVVRTFMITRRVPPNIPVMEYVATSSVTRVADFSIICNEPMTGVDVSPLEEVNPGPFMVNSTRVSPI